MAHFHIKTKKGRPYLYVREIARVDGKPKVVSQVYIGSPERVSGLTQGQESDVVALKVEQFGAIWLACQIDAGVDLCSIVDGIVSPADRETGPSVGEYFLYCVFNRMIQSVSKNKLASWYQSTAIQHIRPIDLEELTSKRYWEKWDRVSEKHIEQITQVFFERIWQLDTPRADCVLFDTTNYYTYMAGHTESELAMRGKNKEGKHHLRQIGLGLLVARDSRLPLYYSVYPGNIHDSKHFESIMDEMFGIVCGLNKTKERLTVVIDKGMNADGNYSWIDEHSRMHFITTYSTYFAQDLAATPLKHFEPVDIAYNRRLIEEGKEQDQLLAYRTKGEYWGKERTVIVTYNPASRRKQEYTFNDKLEVIRQELLSMRTKVRDKQSHWKNEDAIKERYSRMCEQMHMFSDIYELTFENAADGLSMSFRKNAYLVERKLSMFGKNIIITDNMDWMTADIVQASLDRWQVEDRFRMSKDDELVGVCPMRHWTDSKIRCHLFTCVAAMTYLRRIELKLEAAGVKRTASDVMDDMQRLHQTLVMKRGSRTPERRIETPSKTQAEVLSAFGCFVDTGGVLQKTKR
ncbi:MAG TPA: IS1634 family transposase [Smithellaceae bacterium]|jgi:transposase|nr:IS1634 family transposase [Smithellaceae bacterium]HNY96406.1 IS1634 family transposase [Smithellaceae bacterium]HOH57154.1 IS1634 family transposase [Smithellaceae bacterium]HOU57065.1 IS1634 family transposase [Smithellaceae bacterium]HPV71228.1 IS1634 family transposase [Smithellaceae bacterium]